MTRQELIDALAAHEAELREMGIASLEVFGSVANDHANDASDVDLLVDFSRPVGLFHFCRVQHRLEEILGVPKVDLVMRRAVIDELKDVIYREAVPCLGDDGSSVSSRAARGGGDMRHHGEPSGPAVASGARAACSSSVLRT